MIDPELRARLLRGPRLTDYNPDSPAEIAKRQRRRAESAPGPDADPHDPETRGIDPDAAHDARTEAAA